MSFKIKYDIYKQNIKTNKNYNAISKFHTWLPMTTLLRFFAYGDLICLHNKAYTHIDYTFNDQKVRCGRQRHFEKLCIDR